MACTQSPDHGGGVYAFFFYGCIQAHLCIREHRYAGLYDINFLIKGNIQHGYHFDYECSGGSCSRH